MANNTVQEGGLARLVRLVSHRNSFIRYVSSAQSLSALTRAYDALRGPALRLLRENDLVMAMQLWNKALAFQEALAEAAALQWRVETCSDLREDGTLDCSTCGDALDAVEKNKDPLARALGARVHDLPSILLSFLDAAVRSTCPATQTPLREAYRSISDARVLARVDETDLSLDCESVHDHCVLFAACGMPPRSAVTLVSATVWAVKTHAPYAQHDDLDDLALGKNSALAAVITQRAAIPLLNALRARVHRSTDPVCCTHLPGVWSAFTSEQRARFGEDFYRTLLSTNPELLDYFSRCDMDALACHLARMLDFIFRSTLDPMARGSFRPSLERLANVHRMMSVPTHAYILMGVALAATLQPHFENEATSKPCKPSAKTLRAALLSQYRDVMSIMHYPMLRQERLIASAHEFIKLVACELSWADAVAEARFLAVETEILSTGTYTHTSEELRVGAQLAWRNSAKCIGRISWKTLLVRDCRHVDGAAEVFEEVCKHLRAATAGPNVQSVMTVFRPKSESEALGTRFWSSQLLIYAGYKDSESGEVLGDPANLDLADYLIANNLWTPPEPRTAFDLLPLVLKRPGRQTPYIYELPADLHFEVNISHPTNERIEALGYKWFTVPAICNFKMDLGGVVYQNIPFNGWFVSTEISRNLAERYNALPAVAAACGLDEKTNPFWRQLATIELEHAVLHSFNKAGYTIVDPMAVGESFCTHVRRERELGRECPAQWSWIGGLVGPTNPSWHLEMRDFLVKPQYHYCASGLKLQTANRESVSVARAKLDDAVSASSPARAECERL